MAINTSTITLKAGGKDFHAYLAESPTGGPGILLLHAWWGLKPFFKQICDRLAEQGFVVLAPDLRQDRVAQTIEEAKDMMEKSDGQLTREIVMAAKDYLLHLPNLKGRKIGMVGFSMGTELAMDAAARAPEQVAAVALFYGAGAGTDLDKVQAKVLGHFSDVDEWEPYDYIQSVEGKMKAAGLDVTFHTYPGRAHWFVEEDRPEYEPEAAQLAWDRTFKFLKENLEIGSDKVVTG